MFCPPGEGPAVPALDVIKQKKEAARNWPPPS
jgi:hypothetical protein